MKFNRVISFAAALSLMLFVSACDNKKESSDSVEPSKIVGTVGDEKISAAELKFYFNMNKSKMESEAGLAGKSDEEKKKFWETNEDKKQKVMDNTFKDITELKVLLINAEKENVKLEKADSDSIEENIGQFIQEKGNGDKAEAEKAMMKMYGVSVDEYRKIYGDYILAYSNYAAGQTAKIEISDSDIERRFEATKDQYKKVTVKHILIYTTDLNTNQPLSEDKITERKEAAKEILKKAQSGEEFEGLVEKYSQDLGSKQRKGEFTFAKGETNVELENWAFNAKAGDIGIVEASYGIHIVKFIKNVEASLGDSEKNKIRTFLQNEQYEKRVEEMKAKYPLVKKQEVIDSLNLF